MLSLTMNVTLAFVCLCHEEVGDVATDVVFVTDGVTTENLLQSTCSDQHGRARSLGVSRTYILALTRARSQFWRLIMEIISGAALPSSFNLPT